MSRNDRTTAENAKKIIVIDGCYNRCALRILENDGVKVDKYLILLKDLKIEKLGSFKTFEYSQADFEKAVNEIIKICEGGI
jgi:uncharacterized metal-binding protein